MLSLPLENYYKEQKLEAATVLIVSECLEDIVCLSEKCINAGIDGKNILSHNSVFNLDTVLSDNDFTYLIIDASLYNYFVFNAVKNSSDTHEVSVLIHHCGQEVKTLRLISDKNLLHINEKTSPFLLKKLMLK